MASEGLIDRNSDLDFPHRFCRMRLSQANKMLTGVKRTNQYCADWIEPPCIGRNRFIAHVTEKAGSAIGGSKGQQVLSDSPRVTLSELPQAQLDAV
jgi:hypothetical protein